MQGVATHFCLGLLLFVWNGRFIFDSNINKSFDVDRRLDVDPTVSSKLEHAELIE